MSKETLNVSILNRNDTKTNWESTNPKLYNGEIGIDTTSKDFKIGDNTNNWKGLPYYLYGKPTNIRFYIKGTGSTARTLTSGGSPYNRAIVRGTITEPISNLTSGMMVSIKLDISTSNACGTILELKDSSNNILLDSKDSTTSSTKGQHPIVYSINNKLEDRYNANSIINLIYDEDQTSTVYINGTNTSIRGCWKIMEYMLNRSSINNIGLNESYLIWGGKAIAGTVSPIGCAISAEHSANKLAFINGNAITMEWSSDAGTTWTEFNYTAAQKSAFCTLSQSVPIGRASSSTQMTLNCKTRITITAQDGTNSYLYTKPTKLLTEIAVAGSCSLLVEYRSGTNYKSDGAWTTLGTYSISGWTGWNDIPLVLSTLGGGKTQTSNNWQLRLTYTMTAISQSYLTTGSVNSIRLFGSSLWTSPSTMASTGHLYQYDISQNATFPNAIYPHDNNKQDLGSSTKNWYRIYANSIYENGTLLSNKYALKTSIPTVNNNTITINKNGSKVNSFTLNQSTDKTINITVPTKTSDLTNDSKYITGTVTSVTASKATAGTARSIGDANVGTAVSVVTGVGSTKFVTGIAGGSGNLVSETEPDSSKDQIQYIESVGYTELTLDKASDTFLKSINGGSGSLTSNTTSTNGISYLSDISYTSARSSGGGTVGISDGSVSLTGTYTSSNQKLVLNLSYTAQTLTGTTTFVTGITPGSISKTTKYLHHTHTGASSNTTGSALTNVTKSGGTITPTTKFLYHTHNAASVSNQATVSTTTTNITPAVKSTDTITPYTFADVTASKIN